MEELAALPDELGCTMPQLAVAFPIVHPAVTSVVLGPRTLPQLEDLLAGSQLALDGEVLDGIDEIVPPGTDLGGLDMGTARVHPAGPAAAPVRPPRGQPQARHLRGDPGPAGRG